jgi:NADH-quinone oxidoreductase subunit N
MAGFMAKFYVFLSAAKAGLIWLVAVGVINSVISLYYYLRVIYEMYVREGETESLSVDRPAALAMSLCIAGVLALGVFPEYALRAANFAAAALFR